MAGAQKATRQEEESKELLDALRRESIAFDIGRVIVDAALQKGALCQRRSRPVADCCSATRTMDNRSHSPFVAGACWWAGDTKSGKSWVTGLLCEQLILYGYCLCILDPEVGQCAHVTNSSSQYPCRNLTFRDKPHPPGISSRHQITTGRLSLLSLTISFASNRKDANLSSLLLGHSKNR